MPTVGDLISEAGQMPDRAIRLLVESSLPDHIHLLVEGDPQDGVHELVKAVRARSSRVLREEFPWLKSRLKSLWASSYFVGTVGGASLSAMQRYVELRRTAETC